MNGLWYNELIQKYKEMILYTKCQTQVAFEVIWYVTSVSSGSCQYLQGHDSKWASRMWCQGDPNPFCCCYRCQWCETNASRGHLDLPSCSAQFTSVPLGFGVEADPSCGKDWSLDSLVASLKKSVICLWDGLSLDRLIKLSLCLCNSKRKSSQTSLVNIYPHISGSKPSLNK